MAKNGIGIDEVNRVVVLVGADLINTLFEGIVQCTLARFSEIAYAIVKAKAEEYGVVDIGEEDEWHLGCLHEEDSKVLMSYLSPLELEFAESVSTKYGELRQDEPEPEPAPPVAAQPAKAKPTLH